MFICFSLAIILATVFLPFLAVHMILETQVVVLSLLVTRMHRDFWRSDCVSCGDDLSHTTFMAATPDVNLVQTGERLRRHISPNVHVLTATDYISVLKAPNT
ncbi:hypothetical protein CY34DRAFT_814466 [Suillus luteus UH-Slu-Lm8-n1]|uniref:Uncharacterized protein n=1 Tax=Suillus luteus UH-Slu-Lm8-n1 TaxID=930992 RepID=A0A0D0AIV0_9AGAM|nr:hypothetical protein CY34DRAFT_814466 [Suillus luteus UH-Slu-Lm8-n1]